MGIDIEYLPSSFDNIFPQNESREQVVWDDRTGEDLGKYSKGNWPSFLIRGPKKNVQGAWKLKFSFRNNLNSLRKKVS